ncbi:hypothetical protein PLICRDRAFT_113856 [Plicaturopsis crispa FD-325 SS-3]|nr:hypothetical protein PLICRDRAFT_113856 [Plicaturopsis crispa FD-325 SS-3]
MVAPPRIDTAGTNSATVASITQHPKYYLRGGDMTVNIENTIFRVHSYFFDVDSAFFRELLNSVSPGASPQGTSDRNAFKLQNVTVEEFALLLWVFYNRSYSEYEAPVDDWVAILRLANEWQFVEVKRLAIRKLEKLDLDPVQKIVLYRAHNIDSSYLVDAFSALCRRDTLLPLSDCEKLGMPTFLQISEARERARGQCEGGVYSPTAANLEPEELQSVVCGVFNIPSPLTTPTSRTHPPVNGHAKDVGPHDSATSTSPIDVDRTNGPNPPEPSVSGMNEDIVNTIPLSNKERKRLKKEEEAALRAQVRT